MKYLEPSSKRTKNFLRLHKCDCACVRVCVCVCVCVRACAHARRNQENTDTETCNRPPWIINRRWDSLRKPIPTKWIFGRAPRVYAPTSNTPRNTLAALLRTCWKHRKSRLAMHCLRHAVSYSVPKILIWSWSLNLAKTFPNMLQRFFKNFREQPF